MTDIDTAKLRRLLDEATPGPWRAAVVAKYTDADGQTRGKGGIYPGDTPGAPPAFLTMDWLEADAELIVAAINALPWLLDEMDKRLALLANLQRDNKNLAADAFHATKERDELAAKLARVEAELRISHPYPQEDHIRRHYPPLIARLFGILDEEPPR